MKNQLLYRAGDVLSSYAYIYQGLVRAYATDHKGNLYNKNFFIEGAFPGSMTALLTATPSQLSFECLEDCLLLEIDFLAFRKLMIERDDLKLFQIYYLEKNWLLETHIIFWRAELQHILEPFSEKNEKRSASFFERSDLNPTSQIF